MIYKLMNINSLDEELIKKYFPMLTEARQKKIASMKNTEERSVAFCAEIIARQCLSKFCDAPEFSFSLLCNPNSRSVVGNFNVEICIVRYNEFVACAVSDNFVGISIVPVQSFSFKDAQKLLSDSEIRSVFSESVYSFAELVNFTECKEENVKQKFAIFNSLKEAHYYSTGRGVRSEINKIIFKINNNGIICSDENAKVSVSHINNDFSLAVSVVERKKNE